LNLVIKVDPIKQLPNTLDFGEKYQPGGNIMYKIFGGLVVT